MSYYLGLTSTYLGNLFRSDLFFRDHVFQLDDLLDVHLVSSSQTTNKLNVSTLKEQLYELKNCSRCYMSDVKTSPNTLKLILIDQRELKFKFSSDGRYIGHDNTWYYVPGQNYEPKILTLFSHL